MTSVKFESMAFVCYCIYIGKIDAIIGLSYLATALGIKEFVDLKEKSKIGG